MKLNSPRFLISLLYVLLVAIPVFAQQNFGSINGTVTDSSSAMVPDAKVQARNVGTNLEQTATTQKDGSYSIVDLPVGTYAVTITKVGFKRRIHRDSCARRHNHHR
jgi:hypothetical protein